MMNGMKVIERQPQQHRVAMFRVGVVLVFMSLFVPSGAVADSSQQPSLNIFLRARVSSVFNDKPVEARAALRQQFQKIKWHHGSLAPLCVFLRSAVESTPEAKPLLAMSLVADEQYGAAIVVLEELAQEPKVDPWVTAELARARQLLEVQNTWHLMEAGGTFTDLTAAEKVEVSRIVALPLTAARAAAKPLCQKLLQNHGALAPMIDHLRSLEQTPTRQVILALAANADGDLELAASILKEEVDRREVDVGVIAELGRLKERQGRTEEALAHFQNALKRTDDVTMQFALKLRTVQLFYAADRDAEAAETLRELAGGADDSSRERRNYCARVAGMNGDLALTIELFEPAETGKTRLPDLLYLGECLWNLGHVGEAQERFETALEITTLPRDRRYVLDRIVAAARATNTLSTLMDSWLKSDVLSAEQLAIMTGIIGGELGRLEELFALYDRAGDLPAKTRKALESPRFQEQLAAAATETGCIDDALKTFEALMIADSGAFHYRDAYVRLLLLDGKTEEATKIYRDAISETKNSGKLMEIATNSRRMGLDEIALRAASKAANSDKGSQLKAALFSAALHHEKGETDQAVEIIKAVEENSLADASMAMAIVQAYERFGYSVDAIRVCEKAAERGDSERTLRKLIALLEEHGQSDRAYELWRRLWDTATEPMTIMQANDRLLELGARDGRLADLAVELEDRLAEETLSERELTLLLDIYTSVGDPVSAADILMTAVGKQEGGKVETYERLLRVYMECELFGRCTELLAELVELDPENRDDHLQRMAVIALERNNNGDAMVVLEQLAARSPDGILRDSFSASVLNMLSRHNEAALAYRRTLATNPDEVETWLLWGNALAARDTAERAELVRKGKRAPSPQNQDGHKQARELFTVMMEEAEEDDLFVLCVDGLLNVRAPRHTMFNALRRVNERIAARPYKLLLYRLAADLYEDVGEPDEAARMLAMALPVAADSRGIITRELIAMANGEGREQEVLHYGRSLLNISQHLPPEECLALGTRLLEKGYLAEAEGAFQRVITDPNAIGAASDVASRYEDFGLYEKAGRVIRALLIESPFDTELILRLGLLEEKRDDFEEAGEAYSRALELMIARLPRRAGNQDNVDERDRNVGEIERYGEMAIRGLITATRTVESREEVLAFVHDKLQAELEGLEASDGFASQVNENPRLKILASLMRRVAFLFHRPGQADEIDSELFRRYPNDKKLRKDVAAMRGKWQSDVDAGEFLAKHDQQSETFRVIAAFHEGKQAARKLVKDESLSSAQRSMAAVLAAMLGYDELMSEALSGCNLNDTPQSTRELLVAAGVATGRPELVRDVIFTNLNLLRRELEPLEGLDKSRHSGRPAIIFRQIIAAWPALNEQDRYSLTSLYGKFFDEGVSGGAFRASLDFLLSQTGRAQEIDIERLRHYLNRQWQYLPAMQAPIFDQWLGGYPAEERVAAMHQLLESETKDFRAKALSALTTYLRPETLTDELREEFPELAARSTLYPSEAKEVDMTQERERLAKNISTGLTQMKNDLRKMFVLHDLTLRPAANKLPREELDQLLEEYLDSRDPFEMLTAFLLLRHAGREVEALSLLQDIASIPGGSERADAVLAAVPSLLISYDWTLPAVRALRRLDSAPGGDLKLNYALQDPLAILAQRDGGTLEGSARRIHAARLMPSPAQHRQAAQLFNADTRHPDVVGQRHSEFKTSKWPDRMQDTAGGLLSMADYSERSALTDVAALKDGQVELLHWLNGLTPNWYSREGEICEDLALAAKRDGLSPQLKRHLEEVVEGKTLNLFDVKLIEKLGNECPEILPPALAGQLRGLALHRWRGNSGMETRIINVRKGMGLYERQSDRLAGIAAAFAALDQSDSAASLARWAVVLDVLDKGTSNHLSRYLQSLPEPSRRQALTDILPFLGLAETRVVVGEGLDVLIDTLVEDGLEEEAGVMVDRYLAERRLSGGRPRWAKLLHSLVGGLDDDQTEIDDSVLVVLARLGRAGDYEDLLWRKNLAFKLRRSSLNLSMNIGGIVLVDNTAALPEPDQVGDIGRYLEIHISMGEGLRAEGILSPQSQLGQVCLLGQWCAQRGLVKEAASLLEHAKALGADMLVGQLWIADLHRVLGKNAEAEEVELKLLEHDLLPMARVPDALEALARLRGERAADAAAFRLERFTNLADVLERALRHARKSQLKKEYLDLADRLRTVRTRFLPGGAQCPFEGHDTIAEWSTTIAAAAAELPNTPPPRALVDLIDDVHPAIGRVIVQGENPQMIYVPILHDTSFTHLTGGGNVDGIRSVLEGCDDIADHLYHVYGIRNVLLEGTSYTFAEQYNKIPLQRRNLLEGGAQSGTITHQTWSRLLEKKAWNLLPPSEERITGPLNVLGLVCDGRIEKALKKAREAGWLRTREAYDQNKPRLVARLKKIADEYNTKRRAILEEDPEMKREYSLIVTDRNDAFLDQILKPKDPGIVFFGAAHWQELKRQLKQRAVDYAVVVPAGVRWPPEWMDDKHIYEDMIGLGASLKECTIELGDGGRDVITVPIE